MKHHVRTLAAPLPLRFEFVPRTSRTPATRFARKKISLLCKLEVRGNTKASAYYSHLYSFSYFPRPYSKANRLLHSENLIVICARFISHCPCASSSKVLPSPYFFCPSFCLPAKSHASVSPKSCLRCFIQETISSAKRLTVKP